MGGAYERLSRLPNYIRRFGAVQGLRLFAQVERRLPMRSEGRRVVDVPGYPAPIVLRDSRPDHSTFWQCLVLCQYDIDSFPHCARLVEVYHKMLRDGLTPLIIDCGANIGLASIWFASRFPEARIICVEPDEKNFEVLEANTRTFGSRVMRLQGGVWSRRAHLRIVNPGAGSSAFQVTESDDPTEGSTRAYTIDEIVSMAGARCAPFIVKLDIEGAQANVFSGDLSWLDATHLVALELDDWQMPWTGSSRSFFRSVSALPFEYLIRGETIFCFRDFTQAD